MIESPNSDVQGFEPTESAESSPRQEPRGELADRMTDALLGEGAGQEPWDRQFPASCGKGWG